MDFLQHHIESLVFCSQEPIKLDEIHSCLEEMFDAKVPIEDISGGLENLIEKYKSEDYSYEIISVAGGYQFLTKPAYQTSISILLKQKSKKRLSTSALETLAIIAYKQPITKSEVEQIRGVNCDYTVQKLLEKELLEIKGKSEGVGRPILYGTSTRFMEYFGINSLEELPLPKDFAPEENEIGEKEGIEIEHHEVSESPEIEAVEETEEQVAPEDVDLDLPEGVDAHPEEEQELEQEVENNEEEDSTEEADPQEENSDPEENGKEE